MILFSQNYQKILDKVVSEIDQDDTVSVEMQIAATRAVYHKFNELMRAHQPTLAIHKLKDALSATAQHVLHPPRSQVNGI